MIHLTASLCLFFGMPFMFVSTVISIVFWKVLRFLRRTVTSGLLLKPFISNYLQTCWHYLWTNYPGQVWFYIQITLHACVMALDLLTVCDLEYIRQAQVMDINILRLIHLSIKTSIKNIKDATFVSFRSELFTSCILIIFKQRNLHPLIWQTAKYSYPGIQNYYRINEFVENVWPAKLALFIYVSTHCVETVK